MIERNLSKSPLPIIKKYTSSSHSHFYNFYSYLNSFETYFVGPFLFYTFFTISFFFRVNSGTFLGCE